MITVAFNVSKLDVLALWSEYYSFSPTVRRQCRQAQALLGFGVAYCGLFAFLERDDPSPGRLIVALFFGLCLYRYPKWHRSSIRKTADRMMSEESYSLAFGPCTLELSEDGLRSTVPTGSGTYSWSAVDRVALSDTHLMIFLIGPSGFAIPRDESSEDTIREVKEYVETRAPRCRPGPND